jgi:group I intron endonuclease
MEESLGMISSESVILLSVFVPIMIYSNENLDKSTILSDNKDKAVIYMWTYKESGKRYVGSAINFSKRLNNYFKKGYLECNKTMYIYNALLVHGYSAFTLTILEYIDITNLSKEDAKNLILEREQFYLNVIFSEDELNTYNILKVAGSTLGYKHTDKSLAKKTGENHHMFGKTGKNHPFFGRNHSSETIAKISISKGGGTIYVYDYEGSFVNTFNSTREAGKFFNCSHTLIYRYLKNGKLFKKQWVLSTLKN